MTSLQQREKAYEAEFAHQEDLKFMARERAVKALAAWAAERVGKTGEAADAYVAEVVSADVTHLELQPTLERVATELGPVGIGRAEVREVMYRFLTLPDAAARGAG